MATDELGLAVRLETVDARCCRLCPGLRKKVVDNMVEYVLKLYITGHSLHSEQTVRNLRGMLESRLGSGYQLDIVNVLEQPDLAEQENVLATPTLIREAPQPRRRIIGDFSDINALISVLGLDFPN